MDKKPIGMFDSGVGGLTVYKEVKNKMPNEKIIYLGDTINFPYGSKSKESIIELSKKCVEFLLSKNVKMIIIACGTATSQALEELQKMYDIPIIGIINPTVTYVTERGFKDIGVIATRGTIRSNSWEKKIKEKNPQINVYNQECPLLAPMAEEGWTENQIAELVIKEYLKDFHGKKMDALILGCTHYPLYENIIKQELPNVEIINTGTRIVEFIEKSDFFEKQTLNEVEKDEIYLTDTECNFLNVAKNILKQDVEIRSINKN
ncbi:MAG: glutamate racemase [Clostridia bacterium]|nr:glutamate racemase [Clostridia bacterium]